MLYFLALGPIYSGIPIFDRTDIFIFNISVWLTRCQTS